VQRRRDGQGQHDAGAGDQLDHGAATAGGPVDGRSDQRGDEQERGEADHQEQQHPRARRARIDAQEQGVGEGDQHRRVAAHHRRVGDGEPPEP
jgi:hypothetical protein